MTTLLNTEIKRDRTTKDYAIYIDKEIIGYGKDYQEAEQIRTAELAKRRAAIEAHVTDIGYAPTSAIARLYQMRRAGTIKQVRRASRHRSSLYGVGMEEISKEVMGALSAQGWVYIGSRIGKSGIMLHKLARWPETGLGGSLRRYAETEERSAEGWAYEAEQI